MSVRVRLVLRASGVCLAVDDGVWTVAVCEVVVVRALCLLDGLTFYDMIFV